MEIDGTNAVYGHPGRRPYAIGLPFCCVPLNSGDSRRHLAKEYRAAIAEFGRKAEESSFINVKENRIRYKQLLLDDFKAFAWMGDFSA